jgi:glycosyltransferase 2 family protein
MKSHDASQARNRWRISLSWLSGLLVLAGVILVASRLTELERFAALADSAQPVWLLAAFALQSITYVCAAAVWHGVLNRGGIHERFWSIVPLGLAKLFTDQALPTGGFGGTLLVMSGLERRGVPSGIGMAAVLIGMVSFYIAYAIAVAASFVILYSVHKLAPWMVAGGGLFVLVAFGVPGSVLIFRRWWRSRAESDLKSNSARWLSRIPGFSILVSAMAQAPTAMLQDPITFIRATALQLLIFALDAGTLWVMIRAVGADATPATALVAFIVASLAATIGPMPLGLGTFEAVCVTMLHLQGLSIEVALTATLLLRGFTFWLPMLPGLLLARRELSQAGTEAADAISGSRA